MSNFFNHPSQSDHGIHGTALAPTSADLDTVDVTLSLSLNSGRTLPSQNQAIPSLDQLPSHHQLDAARARRSNLFGLHAHSSSNSYLIQPRNNVNLNFFMGNCSSINVNLQENNPVSQFARNNPLEGSSGTPPIINIFNSASSHVQQPISNLDPNQGAMLNRWISETNNIPRFTRHHPQYASPVAATRNGNTRGMYAIKYEQEIPTAIPYLRQNIASQSTHQGHQSNLYQRVLDQSRSNFQQMSLSLSNQPFRYPGERYNHAPSLSRSILNAPNHQVPIHVDGNGMLHANSFHPQPNQPASEDVPETAEQAPEPNSNETTEPASQARRCHPSSLSGRSHPNKRYGPYTCPKCHAVFDHSTSYASHAQLHYKDETPDERMKRRERKIRKREMHIANSVDGITVMPGSLQQGEQSMCRNINAPLIIKEEV